MYPRKHSSSMSGRLPAAFLTDKRIFAVNSFSSTPPGSGQNSYTECLHGSIRRNARRLATFAVRFSAFAVSCERLLGALKSLLGAWSGCQEPAVTPEEP